MGATGALQPLRAIDPEDSERRGCAGGGGSCGDSRQVHSIKRQPERCHARQRQVSSWRRRPARPPCALGLPSQVLGLPRRFQLGFGQPWFSFQQAVPWPRGFWGRGLSMCPPGSNFVGTPGASSAVRPSSEPLTVGNGGPFGGARFPAAGKQRPGHHSPRGSLYLFSLNFELCLEPG